MKQRTTWSRALSAVSALGIVVAGMGTSAAATGPATRGTLQQHVPTAGLSLSSTGPDDSWQVTTRGDRQLVRHWNGATWRASYRAPTNVELYEVDAISPDDVWAVGGAFSESSEVAFAVHWDGSAWSVSTLPDEPAGYARITSVTSISSDQVLATGIVSNGEALDRFDLWWDGSSWTTPTGVLGTLTRLDADGPRDAWGIGYTGDFVFFTAHWNGRVWKEVAQGEIPRHELDSISAVAPDDVWMTGVTDNGTGFTAHWAGTRWQLVPNQVPPGGVTYLTVDATAADDAWLAGTNASTQTPVFEHWDGSTWSPVDDPGSRHVTGAMPDVSAISSSDVWATGSWQDDNGASHRVLEHWDGTSWTTYHHA